MYSKWTLISIFAFSALSLFPVSYPRFINRWILTINLDLSWLPSFCLSRFPSHNSMFLLGCHDDSGKNGCESRVATCVDSHVLWLSSGFSPGGSHSEIKGERTVDSRVAPYLLFLQSPRAAVVFQGSTTPPQSGNMECERPLISNCTWLKTMKWMCEVGKKHLLRIRMQN